MTLAVKRAVAATSRAAAAARERVAEPPPKPLRRPAGSSPLALPDAPVRLLRWAELSWAVSGPDTTLFVAGDGSWWSHVRSIPRDRASEADRIGYSVVLEDDKHWPLALEACDPAKVTAWVTELRQRAAIVAAGTVAQPRTSRPVSHSYTLSSLLQAFDLEGATLSDRGGRALLLVPRDSSSLFHQDVRHAMEALSPLLDGYAAGQPVSCAEPGCDREADSILFPAFPACPRHSELTAAPATRPEPADWWLVPGLSISPAGAKALQLPPPPADRERPGWPPPPPKRKES